MKKLTNRFKIALDNESIDNKIRAEPIPLTNLGALSIEAACHRLENTLKEVFIPTLQVYDLLRSFIAIAEEHVVKTYPDEETFMKKCHEWNLTLTEPLFPICISGLAGVGKTELLNALSRLLKDNGDTIAIPDYPTYPIQFMWKMTMRNNVSLLRMLQPFLPSIGDDKELKYLDKTLIAAAKRAFTCGVSLIAIDEFQFITSTQAAHAKAAKALLQLCLIGKPLFYCVNYDMIHKLKKRPQQERQRLLSNIKFLYPDFVNSQDWENTLAGQLKVAPEAFSSDKALSVLHDGEMIHRYSFGIKRSSAALLKLAYGHARMSRNGVVKTEDIEWAYKSKDYFFYREDVELLKRQVIENKSARDDLWYDLAESRDENNQNVIEAQRAIQGYKKRVNQELVKSSMSKQEREDFELVMGNNNAMNEKKAPVLPIRRSKLTKESLLEGNKAFQNKYGIPNKS